MKQQANDPPIVKIEWRDALSGHDLYASDVSKALELAPYTAIGFKLAENKDCIVICQGICTPHFLHEETLYRNFLTIPKAQVVKVEELQLKAWEKQQ